MTKKIKKYFSAITAPVAALAVPLWAKAAGEVETGMGYISAPFSFGGGITNSNSVVELIANIISLLLFIAGAVAVLFVVIGGFWYLTSGGNEEQAEKGKNTVVNAIIGIVVIILAYVIVNVIVGTVSHY